MKRIAKYPIAAFVIGLVCAWGSITPASAQELPSYREKGYKGNVGIVGESLWSFIGLETSQGYMFDQHTYLGVGVRASYCIYGGILPVNAYLEWRTYTSRIKKNTPIFGIKAGYGYFPIVDDNNLLLEPNLGWSWGLGEDGKHGITLELGCPLYWGCNESHINASPQPTPKIPVDFEF